MEDLIAEMKKELQEIAATKSNIYNFDFILDAPNHESQRFSWTIDQEKSIENERGIDTLRRRRHRLIMIEDDCDLIRSLQKLESLKVKI